MEPTPIFLALLFSSAADLVFLNTDFELLGILLFLLVQYCYRTLIGIPAVSWLKRGAFFSLLLTFVSILCGIKGSLLLAAALLYFVLLLLNLFHSWGQTYCRTPVLLSVCLTLLLICDFHVGLHNLPRFAPYLPTALSQYCAQTASRMIWGFYIPAQLIMLYLLLCSLRHSAEAA